MRYERYTTEVVHDGKFVELTYESNGVDIQRPELIDYVGDNPVVIERGWVAERLAARDLADRQELAYLNAAEMRDDEHR